ncbi:glutamate--cysteine ligase [Ferrimonas pelagia]|uniref:Glutamate--cysteine ligase n=1 Tax=Ferrimonas pelagia TaxID=1177826 RepID=A0ABP9FCA9_9GAMM
MSTNPIPFEQRLLQLRAMNTPFAGTRRGIEKEALRIQPNGQLAQTPHPQALGSALTHPHITTDFAESQLEFVTPALTEPKQALDFLADLHRFTAAAIGKDELLWGASMPAALPPQAEIPLAQYGNSNAGRMKTLYRRGLSNRYGSAMQTISGIHYNFSLPTEFWQQLHALDGSELAMTDYISAGYFALIRNVQRHGWLIPYLFGASPALDRTLVQDVPEQTLAQYGFDLHLPDTLSQRWATSLRLSDLGYTSETQSQLNIRYDSRETYLNDLSQALLRPSDAYRHLGRQQQINSHVLQLENELYSNIRPKRVSQGLRPLYALCHQGVEYIELRSLDINPLLPLGLDEPQSHFLDLFLITMALLPSPAISPAEQQIIDQRLKRVIHRGRQPGLTLPIFDQAKHDVAKPEAPAELTLEALGLELIDEMAQLAVLLDEQPQGNAQPLHYQLALTEQMAKLMDPQLTPSAQILAQLNQQGSSYRQWMTAQSRQHTQRFAKQAAAPQAQVRMAELAELAPRTLAQQAEQEAQPQPSFDEAIAAQALLTPGCPEADPTPSLQEAS